MQAKLAVLNITHPLYAIEHRTAPPTGTTLLLPCSGTDTTMLIKVLMRADLSNQQPSYKDAASIALLWA